MVLEKTLESLLSSKEIKSVNPKGNQPLIFIGRTDAETEAPIFWPSDVKHWLIRKDPDAGEGWRQEENWATEDEMVGSHHGLNGYEFEQSPGDDKRQRSLVCCSTLGRKEWDSTERWKIFLFSWNGQYGMPLRFLEALFSGRSSLRTLL